MSSSDTPDGVDNVNNELTVVQESSSFLINGLYFCDKCNKKVKRKDNFKRHYKQVHGLALDLRTTMTEDQPGCSKVVEDVNECMIELSESDLLDAMTHVIDENNDLPVSDANTETEVECTSGAFPDLFHDGFFHCDHCPKKIKRKDNFKRHYQQVHNLVYTDKHIHCNSKNKCIFPGCDEVFYHKSKMAQHLQDKHRIVVDIECKIFADLDEFFAWKELEEATSFVWFPKKDERKVSNGVTYSSYVCQCNGLKQPAPLKHTSMKRKMVKKNLICPARMLVRTDSVENKVTVKYIKSHNHQISCEDIRNRPIPSKMKEEITEKLMDNKTVDDVYSELHQEAVNEVDKSNSSIQKVFIQKHKIKYLQQKLNLPKTDNAKSKNSD